MKADPVALRRMVEDDLSRVLEWRNHPDIRYFMLTQHEISLSEHRAWFERVSRDPGRELLIFEEAGYALGFVHFSNPTMGGVSDWGFYTAPEAPKGTGRSLGVSALNHAFGEKGLHKVCGHALAFNQVSIKFHHALGFKQEGVLREQHFDGKDYHDLICFGLLKQEWNFPVSRGTK